MYGTFGSKQFASSWVTPSAAPSRKRIALLGDMSTHGGTIILSNQDGTLLVGGTAVAVEGAMHSCPIPEHGITPITAVTVKSYHNGKLIITERAVAGCGALIQPIDRNVYFE